MDFAKRFQHITHRRIAADPISLKEAVAPRALAKSKTNEEKNMARYGKAAGKSVKSAMHRRKSGTLRSGKAGHAGRVKSRKQAIAIGLSEARKKGAKVPRKK
jgi:hypothetical protein